jgi:hypothetical protein
MGKEVSIIMNKEDIRFYLQTVTLKSYDSLSDTEKTNTDYLVKEIKDRSIIFGEQILDTIEELGYHVTPNTTDTVIWRLRKAFFHKYPENSTNSWMVTLNNEDLTLDSTPTNPSAQVIIVVPKGVIFTREHARIILNLGVTKGITLNGDGKIIDANIIMRECVFGYKAKPVGTSNSDIEKLFMLGLISFFVYASVSIKRR